MITVRSLEPFGVAIALSAEAFSAARMPRTKAEVGRAVAEHGMVVLSGADSMTADEMVELMTVFGLPDGMIDFSGTPRDFADDGSSEFISAAVPGQNRVRLLGNATDAMGRPAAMLANIGYEWHQDASTECYSMLFCRAAPPAGAETLFADCAKMFNRLSPEQQEWALQTEAVFSNEFTAGGPAAFDAAYGLRMNSTGTRVIRGASRRRESWQLGEHKRRLAGRDERSRVAYLWAGAKNMHHIVGFGVEESRDMLQELLETAIGPVEVGELNEDLQTVTPTHFHSEVVQPIEWKPGLACIWDNRRFVHSTTPVSIYAPGEREIWQIIHRTARDGATGLDDYISAIYDSADSRKKAEPAGVGRNTEAKL